MAGNSNRRDPRRNDDLDAALGGRMFSGIVTAAQDFYQDQTRLAGELRDLGVTVEHPDDQR
jgi:hypothetical protein